MLLACVVVGARVGDDVCVCVCVGVVFDVGAAEEQHVRTNDTFDMHHLLFTDN